jgi:1,4-dihydroxy-2-naphthoate octaprenyltransferase
MLIPILLGGAGAYTWEGVFRPGWFLITLIGAGAAHLFSNMVNDLWDFRNGVDVAAKEAAATAISTNSGFLAGGTMSERVFSVMTWSLFYIALACGIMLSLASGWWALVLAGVGGLIAYFYVAPPIKFGYRGKGYSEVAILLSFGVLPVMGAYYVQTVQLDWKPLVLSLPIGLLTTLILFNHHFLHWEADRSSGKRTLVVVWGEKRAILFSQVLCFLAYLSLIMAVVLQVLPWYALLALITAVPLIQVYRGLKQHNPSPAYLPLMGASLKAAVRGGGWMVVCLLVQGWL